MNLVGAVDIGGTKIAVGLVNSNGNIIEQEVCPTDREKDYHAGLESIHRLLEHCLRRKPEANLLGIGIGCTGPVDPQTGVLGPNSFLPLWEGASLLDLLQERIGLSIAIENDADAAALGEYAWGAGQGAPRFIYVTVSTGIGCGILLDGRLYRGAGGAHPELGHILIDPSQGSLCYCGGHGCWENLASGPALAAWYSAQRRERGLNENGLVNPDAREVCALAELGDPLAREAVMREGYYLGIGLANLVTTFVPDVIVLGGGVIESWSMFAETARSVIRQSCGLVPYERTALRPASLGTRTGLAGAARVWFHHFEQEK